MLTQQGHCPVAAFHGDESPSQMSWAGGEKSPCPFVPMSCIGGGGVSLPHHNDELGWGGGVSLPLLDDNP